VAECDVDGGYGLVLRFRANGVPLERWQAREERLGRFFGPGLRAELRPVSGRELELRLLPAPDRSEPVASA
jgi:hypothetical protein